ncbi:anaerobic carbon-monoxide dehydrogenase catalytic subunit [Brenneria corticis]|uniref:anaerobic carbon-monoxide dehydrogenase catalytic subunit n=1 Tax=Brenneria corticis TaxID=2173106 RepID=UPI001AEF9B98|nr:anaerobic carbon-monoxide dehydrogenase catalytic subunit [Brenneria sp. CFCC 11842]
MSNKEEDKAERPYRHDRLQQRHNHGERRAAEHVHPHEHPHGEGHHSHDHSHGDVKDYLKAVAEYRKSFPSKADVIRLTPDNAVRELLRHLELRGVETVFDRFDSQKPQCHYGIAGSCCRNCIMGPCRITKKSPRGVCGADADLIVARNLLRMIAAGVAAHGARGREVMLALKAAAEGTLDKPIIGSEKVKKSAALLGIETHDRPLNAIALDLANLLLEDLSRTVPDKHKTLAAFAAGERQEVWREQGILPVSAMHEVFESFHRTTTGTDGDWENVMKQFQRCGLAFAWSSVLGSSIAMDSLFGLPQRGTVKCNVGALKANHVNIALHGHSPVLVSEIVKQGRGERFIRQARAHGAEGIAFYGICCSGLSAMYRYGEVIPLSNAVGAELVLGTGALDLWVADVQDVFPTIMEVARCYQTTVVTTSDSARLPGAEFYGYDHEHANFHETERIAQKIVGRAIESFIERRDVPRNIPQYEVEAEIGFSVENITAAFGSLSPLLEALKSGEVAGIVNLVGCSNPRVIYEKAVYDVAKKLIENNVLVLTNGCASFPLLKLGLCRGQARELAGEGLRRFLAPELPPVWHMGECLDNARASALFKGLADGAGRALKEMPFAFASPEWSNEKGLAAAASFRLLGINSYHCVKAPVEASEKVRRYLTEDCQIRFGSTMVVDVDLERLAAKIIADLTQRREKWLGGIAVSDASV